MAAQTNDYASVLFIGGVEFNKKFQKEIIPREVENESFFVISAFIHGN